MKCSNCGTEFDEGVFCPECGTKLENNLKSEDFGKKSGTAQEMAKEKKESEDGAKDSRKGQEGKEVENKEVFCPKCGEKFENSLSFCPFCGTKLIQGMGYGIGNGFVRKEATGNEPTNGEETKKEQNKKKYRRMVITIVATVLVLGVVNGLLSSVSTVSEKATNSTVERELPAEEDANDNVLEEEAELVQAGEDRVDMLDEEDFTLQGQKAEEEMVGEQSDAEVNLDYEKWVGEYVRKSGPGCGISIWSIDENGIKFAAGIGGSGWLAYRDMRDCNAEWMSDTTAVYVEEYGGRIELSLTEDNMFSVTEERTDREDILLLSGIYEKAGGADQSDYEFVLKDSDQRMITENDLEDLGSLECRIARNEIYARRGRMFSDEQMQNYFDVCTWYRGEIAAEDFTLDMLSDIERKNAEFISEYEVKMGYK